MPLTSQPTPAREALIYQSLLHAMDGVLANQACKCLILRE